MITKQGPATGTLQPCICLSPGNLPMRLPPKGTKAWHLTVKPLGEPRAHKSEKDPQSPQPPRRPLALPSLPRLESPTVVEQARNHLAPTQGREHMADTRVRGYVCIWSEWEL